MYSVLIDDLEVLQQHGESACKEIQEKPGIFERVHPSVWWKAGSHGDLHGNHITACAVDIT